MFKDYDLMAPEEFIKSKQKDYHIIPKIDHVFGSNSVPTDINQTINQDINYKYSEDEILAELKVYLNSTYKEHYGSSDGKKIQVTEFIMDQCENFDFLKGCAIKYVSRYGKKGGYNRKDLLKAVHYLIFMLHYDAKKHGDKNEQRRVI